MGWYAAWKLVPGEIPERVVAEASTGSIEDDSDEAYSKMTQKGLLRVEQKTYGPYPTADAAMAAEIPPPKTTA